jgi:predicted ester cyclase
MPSDNDVKLRQRNKAIARRMLKAWNRYGTTFMVDELISPTLITRFAEPLVATLGQERELVESEMALPREAFPEQHFEEEILIADSEKAFLGWNVTATNDGSIFGRQPTHKEITVTGADVIRLDENGKIAEHWPYYSKARIHALARLGLLDQNMAEVLMNRGLLGRGKPTGILWVPAP